MGDRAARGQIIKIDSNCLLGPDNERLALYLHIEPIFHFSRKQHFEVHQRANSESLQKRRQIQDHNSDSVYAGVRRVAGRFRPAEGSAGPAIRDVMPRGELDHEGAC